METTTCNYNDIGPKMVREVQLRYEDLTVFEFPKCCTSCPSGFMKHGCGRNIPFTEEDYKRRPTTCKLKLYKPTE